MRAPRHRLATALVSAGLLLASLGCDKIPAGQKADGGQWYNAHLVSEEGDPIPFFLQLPADCETEKAIIVNGVERIRAACHRSEAGFLINFPVYGTQIEAWFEPDGILTGHWCRELPTGRERVLGFEARPISEPDPRTRIPVESAEEKTVPPHADVSGTWRMEFDFRGVAKGVFVQEASGVVTGTVEVPSEYGDMRFLAGNVRGGRMHLSTFDGQHAFLLEGDVKPDGTMDGEWIGNDSWDPFVAERVEDFDVPDPLDRVRLAPGEKRLDLEPLRDPKYAGKAVIVEIFGTWCPNCNDNAPVLAELYRKHRAEGLEILGVAYEYLDNWEYKERRVREFKERHGVEWDVVIAESTLEVLASEGLGGLTPIEGVPVTIFVNRDGTVHAVYTGFSGPATGEAYRQAKAQFQKLTTEILNGM